MRFLHHRNLGARLLLGLIVGLALLPCGVGSAQAIDEKTIQELRALKKLCDEGIVSQDVCQEKQRALLNLPPTGATSEEPLAETSDAAPVPEIGPGFLGVDVEPISAETGTKLNLKAGEGVTVTRVLEDSPAEQAGLKAGDVIVGLGDQVIGSAERFAELEASLSPGAEVPVKVVRSAGEEVILDATIIDQRKHPPARMHTSPLGFSLTLPAGWTVVQSGDLKPIFEAFLQQFGENPQTLAMLEYAKKVSAVTELYAKGKASVNVANQKMLPPTTPSASQELCAKFAAKNLKVAPHLRTRISNCRLRTIVGAPAFCLDEDVSSRNKRKQSCWIKKPSQGSLILTLTFDKKDEKASVDDFEKMMASISFLDQGEVGQGEENRDKANKEEVGKEEDAL